MFKVVDSIKKGFSKVKESVSDFDVKETFSKVKESVVSSKDTVVLIGGGIISIALLFAIASVFVESLGTYVAFILGFLIVTETMNFLNGNKEEEVAE